MASAAATIDGGEALERLRAADPPLFLSPSPDLSFSARAASRYIFSALLPHCPKPPIERLLTEEVFDAEQIWSQIDLFSRPILSLVRRELNRLDRVEPAVGLVEEEEVEMEEEGVDDDDDDDVDDEDVDVDDEEEEKDEEEDGEMNGVEDKFLKIKELEDYLEDDEAREYGFEKKGRRGERKEVEDDMDDDEGDEEEDEGDEEDEEVKK